MSNIIIIENAEVLALKIKNTLTQNGFLNIMIINGCNLSKSKANHMLSQAEFIIIDLDNRDLDTVELIRNIKNHKETVGVPIISISESADIKKLKKAISAGCAEFILKPFETETLIKKVYKVIAKSDIAPINPVHHTSSEIYGKNDFIIKWAKDYEIGIEQIDAEHKQIIDRFANSYLLIKEGKGHEYYQELLNFLLEYVNTHFTHEEQLQQDVSYDRYKEHKELHDEFKLQVKNLLERTNGKNITNKDLISISLFIKDWLIHHILIEDNRIKDFIEL